MQRMCTLHRMQDVMLSCDVLLQLGEEVPLERVVGLEGLQPHHLRMHQVRVLTGHHPRLLADQVCPADMKTVSTRSCISASCDALAGVGACTVC